MKRLILASGSPRRKELLAHLHIPFEISVSQIEEKIEEGLAPCDIVMSLAEQKAMDVLTRCNDSIVLGADTLVTYNSRMLGKPNNPEEAAEMLQLLSGKTHEVFTGVAIVSQEKNSIFYERTEVTFYDLTEAEIQAYINTKEPFDKAGAYGIQGVGSLLVKSIHGDYYSVVGLPIARVARELQKFRV